MMRRWEDGRLWLTRAADCARVAAGKGHAGDSKRLDEERSEAANLHAQCERPRLHARGQLQICRGCLKFGAWRVYAGGVSLRVVCTDFGWYASAEMGPLTCGLQLGPDMLTAQSKGNWAGGRASIGVLKGRSDPPPPPRAGILYPAVQRNVNPYRLEPFLGACCVLRCL
jgi:hypothetical protein